MTGRRLVSISGLFIVAAISLFVLLVLPLLKTKEPDLDQIHVATVADLARELESLRQRLGIPGLSAAIGEHGRIIWAQGFGWADIERRQRVQPDNLFHLASLTKPYAATLVLQLVDEGKLDLGAPASDFGIQISGSQTIRVWHLLSHTSSGVPGSTFRYDGGAFGRLTAVVERTTGRPFASELAERIIRPLGLHQTAPNPRDVTGAPPDDPGRRTFDASGLDRALIDRGLVTDYAARWTVGPMALFGPMRPHAHPTYLFAAAGLVASPSDVARFSMALDEGRLLKEATLKKAYTPVRTPNGEMLPYGLGWFVQQDRGLTLVWHFGQFSESSSLIVKIPSRQLTFVVLANSDGLSRGLRLGDQGKLLVSPSAKLFLNWFSNRQSS